MKRLRVLSLGAGVQSTTLALMAARGDIEPPDCAITADTQWEGRSFYEHLDWLRSVLPYPVHVVTHGNLRQTIGKADGYCAIPWYTLDADGSPGIGRRQCTSEYKLKPIMREIRRLLGCNPRTHIPRGLVTMLIGISFDEALRMKQPSQQYMVHEYPLIDLRMTRQACQNWLHWRRYPQPRKSACIGCPYHGDDYWLDLRKNRPDEWAEAVAVDRSLREGKRGPTTEYMHNSRVPLDEVVFKLDRQPNLFGQECEGLCGV